MKNIDQWRIQALADLAAAPPLGATIFFLTTQVTSHRQLDMRVHQVNTKFYAFFNDLIIKINIFLEVRSLCK